MENQRLLNLSLAGFLSGENAHAGVTSALKGLTLRKASASIDGLPYTIWQLMEHIRISMWDIINFSEDPAYTSPQWPEGYWPEEQGPKDQNELANSLQMILDGKNKMTEMIRNPQADVLLPFSHGQGQNLFREAILIIDHTAYHVGQIVVMRRLLGDWS